MDVIFYTLDKKRNSTKRPTGDGETLSCKLKDNTLMLSPSLELALPAGSAPLYNYCYIAAFRRYYYIEWESESTTLWIAHCTEDVLATYRASIGASTKYILRCASSAYWNGYAVDDTYPATVEINTETITATDSPYSSWTLVLGVLGAPPLTGESYATASGVQYYALTFDQAKSLFRYLLGATDKPEEGTEFEKFIFNALTTLDDAARLAFQYTQYIVSAMWMPFDATALGTSSAEIQFGKFRIAQQCFSLSSLTVWQSPDYSIPIIEHPQAATRGAYLNTEPYTVRHLQIEPFGIMHLDSDILNGLKTLGFHILCDIPTGQARLEYWGYMSNNRGRFLRTCWAQLGVPLQISAESNWLKTLYNDVVSIGAAVATKSPFNIAASVGNALVNPPVLMDSKGSNGAIAGLLVDYPAIHSKFYNIVDPDDADNGRPCCKNLQISTLSGYVICDDGEINILTNIEAPPSERELSQISSFLTGGFYYE